MLRLTTTCMATNCCCQVDLVLAEVVGSVASEEGIVATIADARLRHVKYPNDQNSYIPARVQTW